MVTKRFLKHVLCGCGVFSRMNVAALVFATAAMGFAIPVDAKRALLVANDTYASDDLKLKNPRNDAAIIADALRAIGFSIAVVENGTKTEIVAALKAHALALHRDGPDAVGLVHFAGHGTSLRDPAADYYLPGEIAKIERADVVAHGLPLPEIVDTLSQLARHARHIVIFDACRDSPNRGDRLSPTRTGLLGLTQQVRGVLIAYSAGPQEQAADGDGSASPYAAAFAKHVKVPCAIDRDVFDAVRRDVSAATADRQMPWVSDGLLTRVVFFGANCSRAVEPRSTMPPGGWPVRIHVRADARRKDGSPWTPELTLYHKTHAPVLLIHVHESSGGSRMIWRKNARLPVVGDFQAWMNYPCWDTWTCTITGEVMTTERFQVAIDQRTLYWARWKQTEAGNRRVGTASCTLNAWCRIGDETSIYFETLS